jgi:hypothetical protein
MRVLHAVSHPDPQAWALSRHERRLGLVSNVLTNFVEEDSAPADIALGRKSARTPSEVGTRLRGGLQAPLDYDVLHYYGDSLLAWDDMDNGGPYRFLDLKIARALGRRIVFTLSGPVRPGLLDTILPLYADKIFYLEPHQGPHVRGGEFLPWCGVDLAEIAHAPPRSSGRPRILYLAAYPDERIAAALDSLRAMADIEVSPVPAGDAASQALRRADLVIDQTCAGWYGPLGVEAMALGKPILAILNDADFSVIPPGMVADLPVGRLGASTVAQDLRSALDRRASWGEWSLRCRAYAQRWHDPARIAAAMIRIYETPSLRLDLASA